MHSLFDPAARGELLARVARLEAASARQWGKMDPAQMLAHCAIGLEMACGDGPGKQKLLGKLLTPLIRGSILGEKPFGRNAPTDPKFIVAEARDFARERERLLAQVNRFAALGPDAAGKVVHVFFGRLSGQEWGRLMHKHLDHHLRQFGN